MLCWTLLGRRSRSAWLEVGGTFRSWAKRSTSASGQILPAPRTFLRQSHGLSPVRRHLGSDSWCDETTEHSWDDGGWWHERLLGTFLPLHNMLAPEDERTTYAMELRVARHDADRATIAVLSPDDWAETAELDLAGVQQARDLFTCAAEILADARSDPR